MEWDFEISYRVNEIKKVVVWSHANRHEDFAELADHVLQVLMTLNAFKHTQQKNFKKPDGYQSLYIIHLLFC